MPFPRLNAALERALEACGYAEPTEVPAAAAPLALLIAPTGELAMQVQGELEWLYVQAGARVVACVGGMDARREARLLAQGCHIVVGTPARLKDHITRTQLDLSALKVAVLDEADAMLDLGFILDAASAERCNLLFSATIAHKLPACVLDGVLMPVCPDALALPLLTCCGPLVMLACRM